MNFHFKIQVSYLQWCSLKVFSFDYYEDDVKLDNAEGMGVSKNSRCFSFFLLERRDKRNM
jgi:hypothetical protein